MRAFLLLDIQIRMSGSGYINVFQFCFVLETIRTSAMRVIHVIVKTEEDAETAHEVCTVPQYLNFKLKQNLPFHLSTSRHLHPWIQGLRTAAHEVSKFVLRSTTQLKTKRNPTSHFSVHGFLHTVPWQPLKVCLAVTTK